MSPRRPDESARQQDHTGMAHTPQLDGTSGRVRNTGNARRGGRNTVSATESIQARGDQILRGFQPSTNRQIQAVLAATASTSQRTGSALRGFIPRGVSPQAALQIASRIGPFDRVMYTAATLRSRETIRRTTSNTYTVKTQRRRITRRLKRVSLTLITLRGRLAAILPVRTPARTINIPLVMFLAQHLDYPEKKLPRDMIKGLEISRNILPPKALTKREMLPTINMKTNLVARNRNIFRHSQRANNPTLQAKCWEMSVAEYQK